MGKSQHNHHNPQRVGGGGGGGGGGRGGGGRGGGGQSYIRDVNKFKGWKAARQVRKKSADLDRFHKIKALKKYANLCRQEGIESDRVNLGKPKNKNIKGNNSNKDGGDDGDATTDYIENDENGDHAEDDSNNDTRDLKNGFDKKKSRFAKPTKKDPFAAAKLLAIKKQDDAQQKQIDEEKKKKEIERAERAREHLRKQHMKRTSKGQPLMNNKILGLLEKIKNKKT